MGHASAKTVDQGLFDAGNAPNRIEALVERLGAQPQDGMTLRHACVAKA